MSSTGQLMDQMIQELRSRKLTVSFAESCTGGLLSSMLTALPGVSDIFLGTVVSYSNQVKEDLLFVSQSSLQAEGAVSEIVARQMAQGVRKQLKSDWSVSVTGIAGPTGGSVRKPVGTVCFAVAGPNVEQAITKHFSGDRQQIQKSSALFAIEFLLKFVSQT